MKGSERIYADIGIRRLDKQCTGKPSRTGQPLTCVDSAGNLLDRRTGGAGGFAARAIPNCA
jgi:hypothetical protein